MGLHDGIPEPHCTDYIRRQNNCHRTSQTRCDAFLPQKNVCHFPHRSCKKVSTSAYLKVAYHWYRTLSKVSHRDSFYTVSCSPLSVMLFGAMYGNQTHLMRVCNPPPKSVSQHGHIVWCPQRDSNSHAQRPRLLRPLCLPFHHRGIILG